MSNMNDREKQRFMCFIQEYIDSGMPDMHLRGAQLIFEPLEKTIVSSQSVQVSQLHPLANHQYLNILSSE